MSSGSTPSESIENAAKKTAKAANTGKNVAHAIKNAASGNTAGAAVDILKDENLRKALFVLIAFFLILLIFVLYIFPMAIYEGIQTVLEEAGDAYAAAYYSGSGGNTIKAACSFVSTFFTSLWSQAKTAVSLFLPANSSTDFYSDTDGDIIDISDAPADSVYTKLQGTKDKYKARKEIIKDTIEDQAYSAVYQKAYDSFLSTFDQDRDVFNGFIWDESGTHKDLSDKSALQLMSLYTTLYDNTFSNTNLADYLKWLGYFDGSAPSLLLTVFGTEVEVPAWHGTFMPQYLLDEVKSNSDEEIKASVKDGLSFKELQSTYKSSYTEELDTYAEHYGAPAIDLMIKAYVSETLLPVAQKCVRRLDNYSGTFTKDAFSSNRELQEAVSKYSDDEEGYVVKNEYTITSYRSIYHSKGQCNQYYSDKEKQSYYSSCHNGSSMPSYWKDSGYVTLPFSTEYVSISVYQYYKAVTYTVYIYIVPRKADTILALSGISSGPVESADEEAAAS